MANVTMEGQYLGHSTGEFTDKQTGEVVKYASVWLWDGDGVTAMRLKKDAAYSTQQLEADLQGVKFGDVLKAQVSIKVFGSEAQYKVSHLSRVKAQ